MAFVLPRKWVLAMALVATGCGGGEQLASDQGIVRNLDILNRLSRDIADSVVSNVTAPGGSSVSISITPRDRWYVFDAFEKVLRNRGYKVVAGPEARQAVDIVVSDAAVEYTRPRRVWLFGPEEVDRTVRLAVRAQFDDPAGQVHVASHQGQWTDVVRVSDIPSLETPGVAATQATLPHGGVIDDLVEPLIIAGAVAVAIVLLFTVRS